MAITVEYLAIFRRTDSFCKDSASFTRLLQVASEIRVSRGDLYLQGDRVCAFRLSDGEVVSKKQRYFHLEFSWDGDSAPEPLDRYHTLLKTVRGEERCHS
jgi:hypothetical protein